MSGFTGFIGKNNDSEKIVQDMLTKIKHRGPDEQGTFITEDIALGFCSTHLVNDEKGHQSFTSDDGMKEIIFIGEIYNQNELRASLEQEGVKCATKATSEVVLKAYEQWGADVVKKLRGAFVILIWHKDTKTMFAARDMFGVQPFYYSQVGDTLLLSSEIKSFLAYPHFKKELNEQALKPYLTFQFPVLQETFFKNVFKFPAAHYAFIKDNTIKTTRYWSVKFEPVDLPLEHFVSEIDETVRESVAAHSKADVPIGSFLSSGVDSSYVVAVAKPEKTFTVGFDSKIFSEIESAEALSQEVGVEHVSTIMDGQTCIDALGDIQYMMDEPHSNPSIVPLYFLAKLAKEHVKVVYSGEGADEFFGGYAEYNDSNVMRKYKKVPKALRGLAANVAKKMPAGVKGKSFLMRGGLPVEQTFHGQAHIFDEEEAADILRPKFQNAPSVRDITKPIYDTLKGEDDTTKKQVLDFHLWMVDDILLKADKMTMAHGLEVRTPLLDGELLKVAERLPLNYRVNEIDTKYAFREASRNALPEEWVKRKKLGFPVPIRVWLQEEAFFTTVKKAFESEYAAQFFDQNKIMKLLVDHYKGVAQNQRKIWSVYMFLVWYEQYFLKN